MYLYSIVIVLIAVQGHKNTGDKCSCGQSTLTTDKQHVKTNVYSLQRLSKISVTISKWTAMVPQTFCL